jgi:hypothetical protein
VSSQGDPGASQVLRYFVTVYISGRAQVGRAMRGGLDLFEESVREDAGRVAVDGLLTLAEAGRLVEDGHQVLLVEEASRRARAHLDTSEFETWLHDRRRR